MLKFLKKKNSPLPVFMLAGVFLLLALIVRLFSVLYMSITDVGYQEIRNNIRVERPRAPIKVARPERAADGNVFDEIETKYPGAKSKAVALQQFSIPYVSHNPIQGNERAKVQVTVFADFSCGSCRSSVSHFLNQLKPFKDDVLIVYKLMSTDAKGNSSGVFDQIAWRADKFDEYLTKLFAEGGDIATNDFFTILERVGVPIAQQQRIMQNYMNDIVEVNHRDVVLAEDLGLYKKGLNPVFFINGYKLGLDGLSELDVAGHIKKIISNEPLF